MDPDGFPVIEVLPKGQKCNTDGYCSSVLTKLSKIARQFSDETRRELLLQADKARAYTAKSSFEFCAKPDLRVAPHPPDSPDVAQRDYFLFGYINDKLKGLSFPSAVLPRRAIRQTM
jgi:hypothetical protein